MVFECPHCITCFSSKYTLKRHMYRKHRSLQDPENDELVCKYCLRSYTVAFWLKRHIEKEHGIVYEPTYEKDISTDGKDDKANESFNEPVIGYSDDGDDGSNSETDYDNTEGEANQYPDTSIKNCKGDDKYTNDEVFAIVRFFRENKLQQCKNFFMSNK